MTPLVPIDEEEEVVAVEEVREDPLPIPPPYSVHGQCCVQGQGRRLRRDYHPYCISTQMFLGQEPGPSTDELWRNLWRLRADIINSSSSDKSPEPYFSGPSYFTGSSSNGSGRAQSVGGTGFLGQSSG